MALYKPLVGGGYAKSLLELEPPPSTLRYTKQQQTHYKSMATESTNNTVTGNITTNQAFDMAPTITSALNVSLVQDPMEVDNTMGNSVLPNTSNLNNNNAEGSDTNVANDMNQAGEGNSTKAKGQTMESKMTHAIKEVKVPLVQEMIDHAKELINQSILGYALMAVISGTE
ncbi:hypothetical protein BKA82DRAFT_26509 [Pisolithus tinctorius]|nr:hypothetical protein BKA82DRAFT_26509 [Pisolithus tinctorius]